MINSRRLICVVCGFDYFRRILKDDMESPCCGAAMRDYETGEENVRHYYITTTTPCNL
jgi:hypothetical protein